MPSGNGERSCGEINIVKQAVKAGAVDLVATVTKGEALKRLKGISHHHK